MLIILVLIYSKYISNYINKHIRQRRRYNKMPADFLRCWPCWYIHIAILRQSCRVPDFSILRRCWSCCGAGGVVSQYSLRFVRYGLHIGLRFAIYQYLRVVGCYLVYMGGYMHPHSTPKTRTRNLGCLSQNFF